MHNMNTEGQSNDFTNSFWKLTTFFFLDAEPVLTLLEEPKLIGYFRAKTSGCTPIYQIGFKDNEPVYRVSGTCAYSECWKRDRKPLDTYIYIIKQYFFFCFSDAQGNNIGELIIMQPALFPNLILLTCDCNQTDVMIRKEVSEHLIMSTHE